MSRPTGTRDKPELYDKIIAVLEKHPDGLISAHIAKELDENEATIRKQYLPDLIEQGKVKTEKEWNRRRVYKSNPLKHKT